MKRKALEKGSHAGSGYLHRGLGAAPHPPPAPCLQFRRGGLAFSSGRERETGFSSSPEIEGLKRCLLFAPSFTEEVECVIEDSASPHPSKMGPMHTDPQDVVLHFLPPHGLLTSTPRPGLGCAVQSENAPLPRFDFQYDGSPHPHPLLPR